MSIGDGPRHNSFAEIDGFLKSVEEELKDVALEKAVRKENLEHLSQATPSPHEGYLRIEIAEDRMTARASVIAPTPNSPRLTLESALERIADAGITFGIDQEPLAEAIQRANLEHTDVFGVVIAEGREPRPKIPKHVNLRKGLLHPERKTATDDKQQVDYRVVSPFVLVKEGGVVAKLVGERTGKPGMTVLGEEVPFSTKKIARRKPGANIVRKGSYFYAAKEGRFEWGEDFFKVNQVLEITEDVAYTTGHIDFPGDVVLHHGVRDRFHVHAGGSVLAHDTLDASDVVCGGDLLARHGIIGRNQAQVRVEGRIDAKYVENCYVEAKEDIKVSVGVINSFINTLGSLSVQGKGVIIGGKIFAENGVTARQIGSAMAPRTEIHVGTDYSVAHKLRWIQEKTVEVSSQLQRLQTLAKREGWDEELEQKQSHLQEVQGKLRDAAETLVFQLDKNDESQVCVSETVYPGTYIEIVHAPYDVSREQKRVCFRLDKQKGEVVTEPIRTARRSDRKTSQ